MLTDLAPFRAAADQVATAIRGMPTGTRWFVDADTDADGLCAAAVMSLALRRIGHNVLVRASRDKDDAHYVEVLASDGDAIMFLDKGTSHVQALSDDGRPMVVVDHHNAPDAVPPQIHILNPRLCGLDGSRDASASTTAAALAIALVGDEALAWGPTALAGAIGDWQHRPEWQGWNLQLLEDSRQAGHVRSVMQPRLIHVDLAAALGRWKLFDDREASVAWLESLDIDPHSEVEDLDQESMTRLTSAVALRMLALGHGLNQVADLVGPVDQHAKLATSLRHAFRIADACGRLGKPATGIAYLLGDAAAASEAHAQFRSYKEKLAAALEGLAANRDDTRKHVQVAWIDDPALTGMVGGIGMESGILDRARPVCILAPRPDGRIQVSTRGLEPQVQAGLDLGVAVSLAAQDVQHTGGGHPVAAGAVLTREVVEEFLERLDAALAAQGWL